MIHLKAVKTMQFLSQSTSFPIPRVRKVWTWRKHKRRANCWFVMEYIPSETWASAWRNMTVEEREEATGRMKEYVDELSQLHHGALSVRLLGAWADKATAFISDQ